MASIPIANVIDAKPLPIDAQNIVTNPVLVIAGTVGGKAPAYTRTLHRTDPTSGGASDNTPVSFLPLPIIHESADAKHASYHASRTLEWPPGNNPWMQPEDLDSGIEPTASNITNAGTPSAVRDGDGDTYASSDLSSGGTLEYGAIISPARQAAASWVTSAGITGKPCGFRARYSLTSTAAAPGTGAPASVYLVHTSRHYNTAAAFENDYLTIYRWDLDPTESIDDVIEVNAYAPRDARMHPDNANKLDDSVTLTHEYGAYLALIVSQASSGALRLFDFYPLYVNDALADAVAARNVILPAVTPRRVIVGGYVAPDASHTITGWPGGDYTGAAARHTYGGGVTSIDFEQSGSPQAATQAAIEAERARQRAEGVKRAASQYNLTMGERQ